MGNAADEAALMTAFAKGDFGAFNQLYFGQKDSLYRFVRRLLGADLAPQVDEVVQETWMRVNAFKTELVTTGCYLPDLAFHNSK